MREHERDRRASAEEPAACAPAPHSPSLDVLALQRGAGNQAVGRWLARGGAVAEEGGTGTREKESPWKVTVSGIGTIDVISVSWGGSGEGARDVTIVSKVGAHSAKLQMALVDGKAVTVDVVHKSGFKLTVKLGHVVSYSVSGGTGVDPEEAWTVTPPKRKKRISEDGSETDVDDEPAP